MDESITSFISHLREKIAQIIDRPSERDQISMIMRSLQPRFARHLMGFPHTDFGSLVHALYGIEEGISRGLWADSSPSNSKGKKPGVRTQTIRCWCHWLDKTLVPTSSSVSKEVFRHSFLVPPSLLSPPVLVPPTSGRPLLLYLSVSDIALGCMLAQLDDSRKERAIYYLSKRMLEYECKYIMIERLCLALVWATRRLRHYVTEYSILLVSRLDPLRYLFDRLVLTGRLMRWSVLLTEFDIQYMTHKSVKGSIVADHLASFPVSDDIPIDDDFPDEQFVSMTSITGWQLYFDGATNQSGFRISILLISP